MKPGSYSLPGRLLTIALACGIGVAGAKMGSVRPHQAGEIARLKDLRLLTTLCQGGRPEAVLAIPDDDAYRALAAEINARVKECGGVELPVVYRRDPRGAPAADRA